MRQIEVKKITETVASMCQQANCFLPKDVLHSIESAYQKEDGIAREILGQLLENSLIATRKNIALCQDTGLTEIFVELGDKISIVGGSITDAVNKGVAAGYKEGYLRKSMVKDPFDRINTQDNTPAQIYIDTVPGDKLKITILPKGGGSENASALKMFSPSASWDDIKSFVTDIIKEKGINACPPLVVGLGIGGSFSSVAKLAKKALLREIGSSAKDADYSLKENELLSEINATGIGPMGLGGKTTALAVHIEPAPCHIACLPVAISIQCHSCRRLTEVI